MDRQWQSSAVLSGAALENLYALNRDYLEVLVRTIRAAVDTHPDVLSARALDLATRARPIFDAGKMANDVASAYREAMARRPRT